MRECLRRTGDRFGNKFGCDTGYGLLAEGA